MVRIRVPKTLQGKVIGRRGATIKDIESDYPGVRVTVPRRDDPSEIVVVHGPLEAVQRAVQRVKDIAGIRTPEEARHDANEDAQLHRLRAEKDALFHQADEAGRAGNRARRHVLLDAAHSKRREFERLKAERARRTFEKRNSGYGLDQIDLHGLYLHDAVTACQERLSKAISSNVREVTIITGAGHHSSHGHAKIKPAVEELLARYKLSYTFLPGEGGFVVTMPSSRPHITTASIEKPLSPKKKSFFARLAGVLSDCVRFLLCGVGDDIVENNAQKNS